MRFRYLIAVALLLRATSSRAQAGPSSDPIRRLAPAAFLDLPSVIRRDLEMRGCLVPQPWDGWNGGSESSTARAPKNVIRGAFTAAGAADWAVLCSVRDTSQILIYRTATGPAARVVDSLMPAPDRSWLQGVGGGRWGYSRLLQTRPLRRIRAWRTDTDRQLIPQPIDHDAIEQVFLDKAAEAFYYAGGRWYRQITAD
jgi:hypothetical protein